MTFDRTARPHRARAARACRSCCSAISIRCSRPASDALARAATAGRARRARHRSAGRRGPRARGVDRREPARLHPPRRRRPRPPSAWRRSRATAADSSTSSAGSASPAMQEEVAAELPGDGRAAARARPTLPVCVGFGISTPEQAAAVGPARRWRRRRERDRARRGGERRRGARAGRRDARRAGRGLVGLGAPQRALQRRRSGARSRSSRVRHQHESGRAAARLAHVLAARPIHRHQRGAARLAVPRGERGRLREIPRGRRIVAAPAEHDVRAGGIARMQPDVLGRPRYGR